MSYLPLFFVAGVLLVSLTIYVLTGGADYGGGVWDLLATGPRKLQQRQFIAEAIGPIWEADHVWLILIVVILFTGFPGAFAAIMTALNVPITLMLVGIVLRGSAFSFRSYGSSNAHIRREWGRIFAITSLITPALLGVIIGAIASGRVPQNPHQLSDFLMMWLTPFCLSVGACALLMFAYLSATYAAYEASDPDLREDFRVRAIAGAIAVGVMAGLVLLLSIDGATRMWHGLTDRVWIWPLFWITAALALTALYALWTRRYQLARVCAAGEVTLMLWGWALAQFPFLVVPSLTIYEAAAPRITLELLSGALIAGSLLLLPSYKYLLDVFKSQNRRQFTYWFLPANQQPRVVILGGGFGGLAAAKILGREPVQLTIIDCRNHFLFQPLLYQVATAALSPADIASPIRHIVRNHPNTKVVLGEVLSIESSRKRVLLRDSEVEYDYLIVATGATHSYFGHDDWAGAAPGLKTLEQAIEIRRRVLVAFEVAENEFDPAAQQSWLTFVVIGAGPTGVELAGALAETSQRLLDRDFRRIRSLRARIVLMDMAPRVLPTMSEQSSKNAERQLRRLGVELLLNVPVTGVDDAGVTHKQGRIPSRTVIWAAGVSASPLARSLRVPLDKAGRVIVNQDLSIPDMPNVFAIGDLAAIKSDGKPVPGVAPAAMQEGRHVARNISNIIRGETVEPFHYVDKGTVASIGRAAAVAEFGGLKLSGLIAWLAWLGVHIYYLIGFRRQFVVMTEWAWLYLRNERGARLITGDVEQLLERGRYKPRHVDGKEAIRRVASQLRSNPE
ncbi:MAG: cytochrome d ubiquinol oxidase subunit II [Deltaproteobacteria bacterium]|nr:cytochrome d ubiquinol oxidase subunit II [Deltaproteobacteria bacterium]